MEESAAYPHDEETIELYDAYYHGITKGFLVGIRNELGDDFMQWWAESGAMQRSPIRMEETGRIVTLTPLQMAREAYHDQQDAERAVAELRRQYGLDSPRGTAWELGSSSSGSGIRPPTNAERERIDRLEREAQAARFMPRGYLLAQDDFARRHLMQVHAPEPGSATSQASRSQPSSGATDGALGYDVYLAALEREDLLYDEDHYGCTHLAAEVLQDYMPLTGAERSQVHIASLDTTVKRERAVQDYLDSVRRRGEHPDDHSLEKGGPAWAAIPAGVSPLAGAPGMIVSSGKGRAIEPGDAQPGDLVQYWGRDKNGALFGHVGVISWIVQGPGGPEAFLQGAHRSAGRVTESGRPIPLDNSLTFIGRIDPHWIRDRSRRARWIADPPADRQWHFR